ncbi:MAG: GWxTD domain-containing protein [bacterium]|nr:GWxTD domain-containing protein [bacterium]
MRKYKVLICLILLMAPAFQMNAAKTKDPWKAWLKEVEPILTRLEPLVAKTLKTLETRTRFQALFWKARDPDVNTPYNEFKIEFYKRISYAKQFLHGTRSDRGRIYILLGKPESRTTFTGHGDLIDCELWSYESHERPGLLPYMNLVFFRHRNLGDYQLYHPGLHKPKDLLSPSRLGRFNSLQQVYQAIKGNSAELAHASLSIVPGEGNPNMRASLSTSNFALTRIYSLPEREAEAGYVRAFLSPTGTVEVSHSTNSIKGYFHFTLLRSNGMTFLNYAVLPDRLNLKRSSKEEYSAEIHLHLNIKDSTGKQIYNHRRKLDLKLNNEKKRILDNRKVVFRDMTPIIEGEYDIGITFMNKFTKEFYTENMHITVPPNPLTAAVGYQLKPIDTLAYMPFKIDKYTVLTDPRSNFSQKDALEGIVVTAQQPEIFLTNVDKPDIKIPIETTVRVGNAVRFRKPLADIKDDNYILTIRTPDGQSISRKIHVLPFYMGIARPFNMERPQAPSSYNNYLFIRGQQYLASGATERAIADFNKIPASMVKGNALPIIAGAFYKTHNYTKVLELLEQDAVKKEYPVLKMLANSSIEMKKFDKALEYLKALREYGDTEEINHLLAATLINLGKRDEAMTFYEHARKIKNKANGSAKDHK